MQRVRPSPSMIGRLNWLWAISVTPDFMMIGIVSPVDAE
jgi:hypothetical protein